jgi:hypothetical protein
MSFTPDDFKHLSDAFFTALQNSDAEKAAAKKVADAQEAAAKPNQKVEPSSFVFGLFDKQYYEYPPPHNTSPIDLRDRRIIFLRGYIGPAYSYAYADSKDDYKIVPKPDYWRIYLSPELNSYIDFSNKYVLHFEAYEKDENNLEARGVWLIARCPRKDDNRTISNIKEEEMEDIELTYGGYGYELSRSKQYIDGEMLGILHANPGDNTMVGCGPNTKYTVGCGPNTKYTVGCGPNTKYTVGCGPNTKYTVGCEGGGGNGANYPLPTSILCEKYATMVGCDEWDFRKQYYPY